MRMNRGALAAGLPNAAPLECGTLSTPLAELKALIEHESAIAAR